MKLKKHLLYMIAILTLIFIITCSPTVDYITKNYNIGNDVESFLTHVQEYTFNYFWDFAHPVSGLPRDRSLGNDDICVSGGAGMGLMVFIVGVERGFVTRSEAAEMTLKIMRFMDTTADRFHGAWGHWIDGATDKVYDYIPGDDGADIVETAFFIQGVLTSRQYFDNTNDATENEIRSLADKFWSDNDNCVQWDWFVGNNPLQADPYIMTWHWNRNPANNGFTINHALQGFEETMIPYLLGIASPTADHSIDVETYKEGFARGGGNNYLQDNINTTINGYKPYFAHDGDDAKKGMPLFWLHYSYLGFDPRAVNDGELPSGVTFYDAFKNIALIDHAYCSSKPFEGYSSVSWGLTASDEPDDGVINNIYDGYKTHWAHDGTLRETDNGTITPTAALSSIVYTPDESIAAMKEFYEKYYDDLWGVFGFKDSFNIIDKSAYGLPKRWFAENYLAIDQGPIVIMIENYRTQLLWKLFMSHWDIGDPDNPNNLLKKLENAPTAWTITDIDYSSPTNLE